MNKNGKSISLGDRIFARVTLNGRTIYNYVTEKVANMSQLISELRLAMKDIQGLVILHIRNYHQGWGVERPLMLYSEKMTNYAVYNNNLGIVNQVSEEKRQMFFPWETH